MECASAAASFSLNSTWQPCIGMDAFTAQAQGKECALVAACTSAFLLVEVEKMTSQCDDVGVNSTDAALIRLSI